MADQEKSETELLEFDNPDTRRTRPLTEKGAEMYQTTNNKLQDKVNTAWAAVDQQLQPEFDPTSSLKDLYETRTELNKVYDQYMAISQEYTDFLIRTNSADSQGDLLTHNELAKTREQIIKTVLSQLDETLNNAIETVSQNPISVKTKSTTSKNKAAKPKSLASSCATSRSSKTQSKSSTSSYRSNVSSILAQKRAKAEAAKVLVELTNKETSIKKQQAAINEKQQLLNVQTTRMQAELKADLKLIRSQGKAAKAMAEVAAFEAMTTPSESIVSLKDFDLPKENPAERTKEFVENCVVNPDIPGPNFHDMIRKERPQQTFSFDPNTAPFEPSAHNIQANSPALATELTQFLLKKELLLTRLCNFTDQPETYASWKAGFLSVVREMNVNATEETDLLVKWLGPTSVKHAISLRAANISNPKKGLSLIWERLDERFGSPEVVESELRKKLDRFPKLNNKDNTQLYELADILAEIESIKDNPRYRTLLSYFDSSSGVIPIVRKLPYGLQERWTTQASKYKTEKNVPFPPFSYFVQFIREVSRTRNDPSFAHDLPNYPKETISLPAKSANTQFNVFSKKTEVQTGPAKCPLHNTNHTLNECRGFRTMNTEDRIQFMKEKGICFRCCVGNHLMKQCDVTIKCTDCGSDKHASAMHINSSNQNTAVADNGGEVKSSVNTKCTMVCGNRYSGKSCSKNILVEVFPEGHPEKARRMYAILDEQSNATLARSEFFDQFDESGDTTPYTLSSCNGQFSTYGRRTNNYIVRSLDYSDEINLPLILECDQIPNIAEEIPTPEVAMCHKHLMNIAQHIPQFDRDAQVLLLIGRDAPEAHHVLQQITGPLNSPYAQKLRLGWVIIGETCLDRTHKPAYVTNKTHVLRNGRPSAFEPCPNELIIKSEQTNSPTTTRKNLESDIFLVTKDDNKIGKSAEDRAFLRLMDKSFIKGPEGNWVASLPFKSPRRRLPNNRSQAMKRAKALHNSLVTNPVKKEHFFIFMSAILDKGHAEIAPPLSPTQESWYLPLFGVYHPHKPDRIRGVFDSSAKHEGISLNDILLKGPDLTNSLLGVLQRFRLHKVAVAADIESMFYAFQVQENHRDYLRFLWYEDNDFNKQLVDYRMKVHVFGNSPSPAVATFGLRKTADAGKDKFGQDTVDFINRSFYVDDALTSRPTAAECIDLLKRTKNSLSDGGNIRLHKIVSNCPEVLQAFPPEDCAKGIQSISMNIDEVQRSLGLLWNLHSDCFTFQVSEEVKPFTRRGVLSTINSIFDPLGFVAPVILEGKLLLREFMSEPVDWDDTLPPHREQEWNNWRESLDKLQDLLIPRSYATSSAVDREALVFCDASEKAIAAVAYVKTTDETGNAEVGFIMGKAKLAPTHGHTIPRLELCASVLAIQIGEEISDQLDIDLASIRYFTDSKIVLGYLNNETRRFYVYVSNRVERIRKSSKPTQWNYIPTESNPADIATRTIPASELPNSSWLTGPVTIPRENTLGHNLNLQKGDPEVRPLVTTLHNTVTTLTSLGSERFTRFSSWKNLIRAIANLKHILRSFGRKSNCHGWHVCKGSKEIKLKEEAEICIIQIIQTEFYSQEREFLFNEQALPKNSPIRQLNPYIDEDRILRVGGRLNKATLPTKEKNPIILPGKHHISKLLVLHFHEMVRHQGRHFTEGAVRSAGFWITGCKKLVSSICHHCVKCRKLRATTCHQQMSDLPPERLTPAPPFTYVGVDTFGHWTVMTRRTRGGVANNKRWAIMFSCLVTRAIHIEVVEDLSSSSFINALRRFLALRGKVKQLRSDRGTNFIGATEDLQIDVVNVEDDNVRSFLYNHGVEWIFNPPHSSHMGGSWERMIGLTRRILDSLLTDTSKQLTHDVLVTFMAEVCAIVNSRPLVSVSTDPESPFILTPNTILTQKVDSSFEPLSITVQRDVRDIYRVQWKRVQLLANTFWKRWKEEYIQTLQPRRKWVQSQQNIKEGDVILLKCKNEHRSKWPIGIITKTLPSEDNQVRKGIVRVIQSGQSALYTRPVTDMILLISHN